MINILSSSKTNPSLNEVDWQTDTLLELSPFAPGVVLTLLSCCYIKLSANFTFISVHWAASGAERPIESISTSNRVSH